MDGGSFFNMANNTLATLNLPGGLVLANDTAAIPLTFDVGTTASDSITRVRSPSTEPTA